MTEKAAKLIGQQIPMHQKLGQYGRDPAPSVPFVEPAPVMGLGEKIVVGLTMVGVFVVLAFSELPW